MGNSILGGVEGLGGVLTAGGLKSECYVYRLEKKIKNSDPCRTYKSKQAYIKKKTKKPIQPNLAPSQSYIIFPDPFYLAIFQNREEKIYIYIYFFLFENPGFMILFRETPLLGWGPQRPFFRFEKKSARRVLNRKRPKKPENAKKKLVPPPRNPWRKGGGFFFIGKIAGRGGERCHEIRKHGICHWTFLEFDGPYRKCTQKILLLDTCPGETLVWRPHAILESAAFALRVFLSLAERQHHPFGVDYGFGSIMACESSSMWR